LHAAVVESHVHLKGFMPWADDEAAMTLEQRREQLASWLTDEKERHFGAWQASRLLRVFGLKDRIAAAGREIGYWVRVSEINNRAATFGARGLTRMAFADPTITHAEIHHDGANVASERDDQTLGSEPIEEQDRELDAVSASGKFKVWRLTSDKWMLDQVDRPRNCQIPQTAELLRH